jgi:glutamate--cysteine ligase
MSRRMTSDDERLCGFLDRPLKDTTPEQLAHLFQKGIKPPERWMIGLEIELFPIDLASSRASEYPQIVKIFEEVRDRRRMASEHEITGSLTGLRGGGHCFSLEPGGQMEIATSPFKGVSELSVALHDLVKDLVESGKNAGARFYAFGHHPLVDRDSVPKMPKVRYDVMRAYLPRRGARGLDMMHLTGSVQCAVDFSDEQSLVDKVRAAALASPFVTSLTAASPLTLGKPNGMKSMRYEIWRDVDRPRCGLWPEMIDERGLTFTRYIERALDVPAMLFVRDKRSLIAEPKPMRAYAQDGFMGTTVTVADFVDHLTTLFPEIRVKSYVELRGADCLPPNEALALAALWRGLLDFEPSRRAIGERLSALSYGDLEALQREVARHGPEATSPVGRAKEIASWLVRLAHDQLRASSPNCAPHLEPLLARAESGRCPADEILEAYAKGGIEAALENRRLA